MRVVKAILVLSAVTSWARGANEEEDLEDVDIDEEDVGDEHHETPEEEEGHHVEHDEEDAGNWELTKEHLTKMHAGIDANKDGKINIDEMLAYGTDMRASIAKKYAKTDLAEMDRNKDGKLSLQEYFKDMGFGKEGDEDYDKERVERETLKFHAADEDKDALLDEHELVHLFNPAMHDKVMEADAEGAMKDQDKNGDGKLSPEEYYHAVPEEGDEEFEMSKEDKVEFAKFDKDKDGFLNKEEFLQSRAAGHHIEDAMLKLIELGDMDGDEHLSASELEKSRTLLEGSEAEQHLYEWVEHAEL